MILVLKDSVLVSCIVNCSLASIHPEKEKEERQEWENFTA